LWPVPAPVFRDFSKPFEAQALLHALKLVENSRASTHHDGVDQIERCVAKSLTEMPERIFIC
jgi:hypothetical protein